LQGRRITWFGDLLHESRNAADVLEQQGIRVPASSGQNRKGAAPDFQVHMALSGVIAGKFHNAPFRDSTSPMSHMGQLQTLASQQASAGTLHYHQDLPPCLSYLLAIERESAVFGQWCEIIGSGT